MTEPVREELLDVLNTAFAPEFGERYLGVVTEATIRMLENSG